MEGSGICRRGRLPVRMRLSLGCASVAACLVWAAPAAAYPDPAPVTGDTVPIADPSVLIQPDATGTTDWYVFSTATQAHVSTDRRDFKRMPGAVLPKPLWWQQYNQFGDFWAPDVVHLDGKYWMYYSVSNPTVHRSAIGLATSPTGIPGTWVDTGAPILTSGTDDNGVPYNALDPSVLVDYSGNRWLVFGSYFGGIYITRLNHATGVPTGPKTRLASNPAANAVEGANMVKHGGAYYLFASYGNCCGGHDSTYHVKVGRGTSPTGPFAASDGAPMIGGGGTMVLDSHGWVKGPGGQTVVYDPSDQREKFVYHYWDTRVPVQLHPDGNLRDGRRLGFNDLEWDAAGWPYVAAGARTADVEVAELESGSEPGPGSGPVMDGWHVFAPGWVDRTFTVSDDSDYTLAVSARGRQGGGAWPIMRLLVDGRVIEERTIDSTRWTLYRFDVGRLGKGQHRARFELVNDYWGGDFDDDRNIYVDKLTASSTVDAESMDIRSGQGGTSDGGWVMQANGKLENAFDFSTTSRYSVRVRAKGSNAGGAWPQVGILVDGVEVAKVPVNSTAWSNYDLEVPAAAGVRRLAVRFANHSAGRNLWVDTVSAAAVPATCIYEGPTRPAGANPNRC